MISGERNKVPERCMLNYWELQDDFSLIHFDHSHRYFFPVGSSTDVIENGRMFVDVSLLHFTNKLNAVFGK